MMKLTQILAFLTLFACSVEPSGNESSTLAADSNAQTSESFDGQSLGINISENLVVGPHADVVSAAVAGAPMIDGPVSMFMAGGERRSFTTSVKWFKTSDGSDDFYVYHSLMRGDLNRPFKSLISRKTQSQLFTNSDKFPGRWWIVNTYEAGDGILAFVHVEFASGLTQDGRKLNFGRGRIALAWSSDGGNTFRFMGNVISAQGDPVDHNVEGAPYIIKDNNFYVYYRDTVGLTVARASVSAVLSAARSGGSAPAFEKWNGGTWTAGMGGPAKAIAVDGITHSDSAYSTTTKKFYLTTTRQKTASRPSVISVYESADAVQWTRIKELFPLTDGDLGWQYLSMVDSSGRDNAQVGSSFFIYCGKNPLSFDKSELWRMKVDLTSSSTQPNPPGGTQPNPPGGMQPNPPGGTQPAPPQGIFKVGVDLFYSNGEAYCRYNNWPAFMCMTGLTNANNVTSLSSRPSSLRDGGICEIPARCK